MNRVLAGVTRKTEWALRALDKIVGGKTPEKLKKFVLDVLAYTKARAKSATAQTDFASELGNG